MKDWFMAGGFGMWALLIIGAGAIGYGVKTLKAPTAGGVAALKSLSAILGLASLGAFGTNMWAVNVHLSNDAFLKAAGIANDQLAFTAMIGFTEASQVLTLGAHLALAVVVIRMIAEARLAKADKADKAAQAA